MKRPPKPSTSDPQVLLQMDLPLQAAWAAALHGPIDVGEEQLLTEAHVQAAWATPVREPIDLAWLTAIIARWKQQYDAVQEAEADLPPPMTLWQFSTQCLGFSPKQLRGEVTYSEWLSRYRKYRSQLLAKADADLDVRRKVRTEWLNEQLAKKPEWSSYNDIPGLAYNTIVRWASGKPSNQDRYVRGRLVRAFGCAMTAVPK